MSDRGLAILLALGAAVVVVHLLTGGRYGLHRDELATLDDARHLAWGYVAYPPVTPFFGWLSLKLFGTSLTGFRFFASVSVSVAVVLTGLMARELGGRTGAQAIAASAAIPFALGAGSLMQYVAFDYLAWVVCSYFFVRLCRSHDPRWWLAIGACVGLGMLTKYSMVVCAFAIATGALFTDLRADLRSKWLWLGVAASLLIFLPNLLWQIQNHFVSLDFLRHIHDRDVRIGRTKNFLPDQLKLTLFTFPLAIVGLWFYLASKTGPVFSSGRIFVRDSADYFPRCQGSRLLPRSGLSAFVCRRSSFSSRNDYAPAPGLAPFTGVVCVGFCCGNDLYRCGVPCSADASWFRLGAPDVQGQRRLP